jgi:hypothetical protein
MTLENRRISAWARSQATWFVAACLFFAVSDATASAAPSRQPVPTAAASAITTPAPLLLAAQRAAQADRTLVTDAKAVAACTRAHPDALALCAPARAALQRAGSALRRAERHLASVAGAGREARAAIASVTRAPRLNVAGERLSWTRVARAKTYVLLRDVPGQPSEYSLVDGTSSTPAPVPGASVSYAVRTTADRSSWSGRKTVTYPWRPVTHPSPPSTPPVTPPAASDPQSAPTISVSGETLEWTPVAGVSTYVLATRRAGAAETFTSVSGTSLTPPAVSGATVHYSVRTAVDGGAWSSEVAITYPASAPPTPPPTEPPPPKESPAPGTGSFQFGINSNTWLERDVPGSVKLGAKIVRIEFEVGETAAEMEPVIAGYAAKGIRVAPLAGFEGTLPTPAQARGLASWAKAYGPGGTYWAAHGNGQLAIQTIEFGNETSGGNQYGDSPGEASYQARAENYALRLKETAEAISAAGTDVGLLAVSEDWTGDWMNGMFSAVPNLGSYVAGWVSHPYGTGWKTKIEDIISQAKAHGAPSTIPIDITEWGLSTDNGDCVYENYGYNPCMTYQEAAETLRKDVKEMGQLLGARAGLFLIYQVFDQERAGASDNREGYFGLLQNELQPKGAYTEAAEELLAS